MLLGRFTTAGSSHEAGFALLPFPPNLALPFPHARIEMNDKPVYERVVLELSGEMLKGADDSVISFDTLNDLAIELIELITCGVELGVVVGGGNIWRGASTRKIELAASHQIGMLATVQNALALQAVLEKHGVKSYIASTLDIKPIVEECSHQQVIKWLKEKAIVIFAGGTGQPFFTTDTGAVLWALKIQADVLLKATKVSGVYSKDPIIYPNAQKYARVSFAEAIRKELRVMDLTAFSLCMDNNLPIVVFKLTPTGNIKRVIFGEEIGTIVK